MIAVFLSIITVLYVAWPLFVNEKKTPVPVKVKASPAPAPAAVAKFCSQCGAKLKNDDKFCSQCGHKTS